MKSSLLLLSILVPLCSLCHGESREEDRPLYEIKVYSNLSVSLPDDLGGISWTDKRNDFLHNKNIGEKFNVRGTFMADRPLYYLRLYKGIVSGYYRLCDGLGVNEGAVVEFGGEVSRREDGFTCLKRTTKLNLIDTEWPQTLALAEYAKYKEYFQRLAENRFNYSTLPSDDKKLRLRFKDDIQREDVGMLWNEKSGEYYLFFVSPNLQATTLYIVFMIDEKEQRINKASVFGTYWLE